MKAKVGVAAAIAAALLLGAPGAQAHCDTLDGPVAKAVQKALETGNLFPVLAYAPTTAEGEIRTAFDKSRKVVAFEGRIVVVGFTSGRIPEAPANHALVKNYSVVGLHWGLYRKYDPSLFGMVHEQLTRLVDEGAIDPLVGAVHPLEEAPQALKALADRNTVGKVVLVP